MHNLHYLEIEYILRQEIAPTRLRRTFQCETRYLEIYQLSPTYKAAGCRQV